MIIAHIHSHLSNSFWGGLIHPLTGWDHLLMLVSIGFLSAHFIQHQKRILGALLIGLLLGGGLGAILQSTKMIEFFIGASLLLCGYYQIKGTSEVKFLQIVSLVGVIGFVHGMAHGMELKESHPYSFFGGMLITSFFVSSVLSYFICNQKREWRIAFASVGVLTILGGSIKLIGFNL